MTISNGMRGALAGAIGGIVGGAVKLACEALAPPRPPGREPPPGIIAADLVRRTDGRELSEAEIQRAAMSLHWIFSTLSGALEGLMVESMPSLESTRGVPFGVALWIGLHEILLPVVRATPPLSELPASEQINECITHGIYGFTVEATRRSLRPLFAPL